jgi:hypothetical protein
MIATRNSMAIRLPPERNSTNSPTTWWSAGQRNRADDHTGRTGGNANADHVAGAGDHAVDKITPPVRKCSRYASVSAEKRFQWPLGQDDEDHGNRRPIGGQGRRQPFDQDAPDQNDDRQEIIEPGDRHIPGPGKNVHWRIRIVHFKVRMPGGDDQKDGVGREKQERRGGKSHAGKCNLDPAKSVVDRGGKYGHQDEAEQHAGQPFGRGSCVAGGFCRPFRPSFSASRCTI